MTPFLFDVRSELRQQVRRVAFHRKNCIFQYFPPSLNLCLYVFLTLLLTMSVLVTLNFCSQVRVNGGRYIDLLRSRCAELRAVFASFNCILHNHFMQ